MLDTVRVEAAALAVVEAAGADASEAVLEKVATMTKPPKVSAAPVENRKALRAIGDMPIGSSRSSSSSEGAAACRQSQLAAGPRSLWLQTA